MSEKKDVCEWYKKFDGHYSMTCTNVNGKRANGNFKKYPFLPEGMVDQAKWDFTFCPYCGKEIEVIHMDIDQVKG